MGASWSASMATLRERAVLRGSPGGWQGPLEETALPPAALTRPMSRPLNLPSHSSEMVFLAERASFPPQKKKHKQTNYCLDSSIQN